ncbi:MAG TPA: hypothetical protein VEF89_08925 [Solirubrobacteraceae bacterium]|nr:hypothetical protein [Solirubrobacteraceae bacterium]
MCGIAGLYTKSATLREHLGAHLADMLEQLSDRGPDSAGVAFYRDAAPPGWCKVSLHSPSAAPDWNALSGELSVQFGEASAPRVRATHAVFEIAAEAEEAEAWLLERHPELTLMSAGRSIEIYKEADLPTRFVQKFALSEIAGSHALGHTRMATESRVTTAGSHPFSTGLDLCLVHNGSCRITTVSGERCSARAWCSGPRTTARWRPGT